MRHRFGGPEPDNYPMQERIARERMPQQPTYLDGLQAGRAEMLASVTAWMTATPFNISEMWGEYVKHMRKSLSAGQGGR